jgi:hypothetical protein
VADLGVKLVDDTTGARYTRGFEPPTEELLKRRAPGLRRLIAGASSFCLNSPW